jgi:adenosylcobinamide-phosphate synthase
MTNLEITFFAFVLDKIFGEFKFVKSYKHPVVFMGDFIKFYENKFYKDSILSGFFLTFFLLIITFFTVYLLEFYLPFWLICILGSTTISSKMLYQSTKDIINNPKNIRYLVSRDTTNLTKSDINKATIETYSENLNDGVVAPLFYLLLFGILGAFVYKAINTLDSMVGYRTNKYENFGKIGAKLDDIVNFIPARITAFLIGLLMLEKKVFTDIFKLIDTKKSPNAPYPITAMAIVCDISLGGDTYYFGKIRKKPYFGDGTKLITHNHIKKALSFQQRFDIFVIVILGVVYVL